MNSKTIVTVQNWWMKELQQLTKKVMLEEEKRQNKVLKKYNDALADYASTDQILDAYGFGCITERKKDKLLDLWEQREQAMYHDEVYQMKLDLLSELYQVSKNIVDGESKYV